jgi:hypothetical protein
MLALTPVTTSIILGGACYVTTKACRYLCTRPNLDGRVASVFDKVRIRCADFQKSLAQCIGEQLWDAFSDIVFDNAWITLLVFTNLFLPLFRSPNADTIILAVYAATAGSYGFWTIRLLISNCLPTIATSIAAFVAPQPPRHYSNQ